MERRTARRFKPNQSATLRVIGFKPGPVMRATVLDISESGLRVRAALPVPCGTLVDIDTGTTATQGTVCRCEAVGGSFEIGVVASRTATRRPALQDRREDALKPPGGQSPPWSR